MGNDCWNSMTITCEKYPDELTNFFENEIEYNNNIYIEKSQKKSCV